MRILFLRLILVLAKIYEKAFKGIEVDKIPNGILESEETKAWIVVFLDSEYRTHLSTFLGSEMALIRVMNLQRINHKDYTFLTVDELTDKFMESVGEYESS